MIRAFCNGLRLRDRVYAHKGARDWRILSRRSKQEGRCMIWISIDEIGRDLPGYLRRVEAGETLVILRAGKPVAELKPAASHLTGLRPFGLCAGEFVVPDDFDEPLPESILNEFEGR